MIKMWKLLSEPDLLLIFSIDLRSTLERSPLVFNLETLLFWGAKNVPQSRLRAFKYNHPTFNKTKVSFWSIKLWSRYVCPSADNAQRVLFSISKCCKCKRRPLLVGTLRSMMQLCQARWWEEGSEENGLAPNNLAANQPHAPECPVIVDLSSLSESSLLCDDQYIYTIATMNIYSIDSYCKIVSSRFTGCLKWVWNELHCSSPTVFLWFIKVYFSYSLNWISLNAVKSS